MKRQAIFTFCATVILCIIVVPQMHIFKTVHDFKVLEAGLEPLEECDCSRKSIKSDNWQEVDAKSGILQEVTCSEEVAKIRGNNQKVIAYTFYSG